MKRHNKNPPPVREGLTLWFPNRIYGDSLVLPFESKTTSEITLACRIRLLTARTNLATFTSPMTNETFATNVGYRIGLDNDVNQLIVRYGTGSGHGQCGWALTTAFDDLRWHWIMLRHIAAGLGLYTDDVLRATTSGTATVVQDNYLALGGSQSPGKIEFDTFVGYNRVLSFGEMTLLYNWAIPT